MIILDSSAAMRSVLADDVSNAFSEVIIRQDTVMSPSLYLSETTNALWKEVRFNALSIDLLPNMLRTLAAMTKIVSDTDYIEEALSIAIAQEHPVYDCLFIAMSRALNAPILTADKKLRRIFSDDQFVAVDS